MHGLVVFSKLCLCTYDAMFMASKLRPFALFVKMRPGPILAALKHSLWFSSARAAMHSLVKDFIRKRQEDEEKAEKLFIDSVLDCDFMDEEEVCLYLSFNFQFQSWSGVNTHNYKLYQWNFHCNVFATIHLFSQQMKSYGVTIQMKCYQQCFHILLFIFSNDLHRLQILDHCFT